MRLSGLLHRSRPELPGLAGTARVDRRTDALLRRLRPGEIAVLDQIDLDRPKNVSLKLSLIDRYDSTPEGAQANNIDYSVLMIWKL